MWRSFTLRKQEGETGFDAATAALLAIYKRRPDLQKAYPEVADGNLTGLTDWARRVVAQRVKDLDRPSLMEHAKSYLGGQNNNHISPSRSSQIAAYLKCHLRTDCHRTFQPSILELRDLNESYRRHIAGLIKNHDLDTAMNFAIGGNYQAFGIVQRELLIQHGLQPNHRLIDVGCGSGRLASALKDYLAGDYLGTDVVPELLEYARKRCPPQWRFELAEELAIPEASAAADMVCFFSVFTHLLHEQSFEYLMEAVRVLKPGGKIIFSFLEFDVDCNWGVFEAMLRTKVRTYLNMFIGRDAVQAWARHLGASIEHLQKGDERCIPLPHPIILDDGSRWEGFGALGQSVAVLVKT
jgi:ubiquinone/menaquinone biosynthesis C-methylase UbiE